MIFILVKSSMSLLVSFCSCQKIIYLIFISDNESCPSGRKGSGGMCRCDNSSLWQQDEWRVFCDNGLCKATQIYPECLEQIKWKSLGDGSYCQNNVRTYKCQMIAGK